MTHSRHQILEARATSCREVVTSMSQVVEVQALHADRPHRVRPARHLVEVTASQRTTHLAWKDQRARLLLDEGCQVLTHRRNDHTRDADDTTPRSGLGRTKHHFPISSTREHIARAVPGIVCLGANGADPAIWGSSTRSDTVRFCCLRTPVPLARPPDYDQSSARRDHQASAAVIALSASRMPLPTSPAVAAQCRGIRATAPGSHRCSSRVSGSGAVLS